MATPPPTTESENCYHSPICSVVLARCSSLVGGGLVAAGLAVLGAGPAVAAQPVVAANGILCDLVRTVAGPTVAVACLVPDGADPHDYRLSARDRASIQSASVVFLNGYRLSPALERLGRLKRTVKVAEVAVPSSPGRDPHVWHNPLQAAAMAKVVSRQLKSGVAPSMGGSIDARVARVDDVLTQLDRWAVAQFATVPKAHRVVLTEHDALSSLAKRYRVRYVPLMRSFASGGPLRPSSLREISQAAQASGTKVLFSESKATSKTLRRISKTSGLPVYGQPLVVDGVAKGKSYVSTFVSNICTLVNAQGGRCDRSSGDRLASRWKAI